MRNGVPLHELRKEVQVEAGLSSEEGATAFSKDRLNLLINRVERMMKSMHDWPTQNYEIFTLIPADTKRFAFPLNVTVRSIRSVHVEFGQQWLEVSKGVSPAERGLYTDQMRAAPAMRWDYDVAHPDMFEIWPISQQQQRLMFRGQKAVGAMEDENDTCTLDADVIVLRVAAEILGRDKQEDAAIKLQMAESHTQAVLKDMGTTSSPVSLSGRAQRVIRPGIDFIPPGSNF